MKETFAKINLLIDILKKKRVIVSQILNITENQEFLLLGSPRENETTYLFSEMSNEKQKLIDELLNGDNVFQNIFNGITDFEKFATENKDIYETMKAFIVEVTDFDVKIRLAERKNKETISNLKWRSKTNIPKMSKKFVLEEYKKSKKYPEI